MTEDAIGEMLRIAFAEDSPHGDLTSEALFLPDSRASASVVARQPGVMSGGDIVVAAFVHVDPGARVVPALRDGERFSAGQVLATVESNARSILRAERIALNFVQRMCGIATTTATYVEAVSSTAAKIVDTRKTTPGLRVIEKYAVRCGGGMNHRFSLSDAVLVKDNHVSFLQEQGLIVKDALRRLKAAVPFTAHIEVEVDKIDQIEPVLASEVVDSILIDNFSLADTRQAVFLVGGRALINASGGISSPEEAALVADAGVDLISIGALTHSAPVIDIAVDSKFFGGM